MPGAERRTARRANAVVLSTAIGKYPHTSALQGRADLVRPPPSGFRRHRRPSTELRPDGAGAALRRERDGDRDLSSGEGLRQTPGAAARGAGRALPAIRPPVPGGQRHPRPRRSRGAPGGRPRLQPNDRRLAARHPGRRATACGPRRCAGSPSRMRMWRSTATRPGPSGLRPARTCWRCSAKASWTRSSSATTCRTIRRSGPSSPTLTPPPRRSGASTASCRSTTW